YLGDPHLHARPHHLVTEDAAKELALALGQPLALAGREQRAPEEAELAADAGHADGRGPVHLARHRAAAVDGRDRLDVHAHGAQGAMTSQSPRAARGRFGNGLVVRGHHPHMAGATASVTARSKPTGGTPVTGPAAARVSES